MSVPLSATRHEVQLDAALRGKNLPRHQVRVVLHLGQQDAITLLELARPQLNATRLIASVALRVQITSFGQHAPMKAVRLWRARPHTAAVASSLSVCTPAVDVRVGIAVVAVHRVQDRDRLLRAGCVVQVDELLARICRCRIGKSARMRSTSLCLCLAQSHGTFRTLTCIRVRGRRMAQKTRLGNVLLGSFSTIAE
jgi:hypothetical protein